MHYENENMDELFRRAAENYPLDTSSKDWNKVMQALQTENGQPEVAQKNNRGRFLWLLLLLPMGLVCNQYFMQNNNDEKNISSAAKEVIPAKPSSQSKKQTKTEETGFTIAEKQKPRQLTKSGKSETSTSVKQPSYTGYQGSITQKHISEQRSFNKSSVGKQKVNRKDADVGQPGLLATGLLDKDISTDPSLLTSFIGKNSNQISPQPVSASSKMIADPNERKIPQGKLRTRKFYLGAVAGLDVTTIKSQKVQDPGFDYGALIGYDLSSKWSIESGVLSAKKIYYSDGKYFNTSKIWMPPNSKITEVEGDCYMIEIPLAVKYNISSSAKHSWFAVVGASSYIMRKEDYNSTYYYANSGSSAVHYKQYKTHSANMFSAIQISGGYTHSIGKWTDLRVEPYLKLPTTGMGIGELPFVSAGLHLGITGKLF